MNPTLQKVLLQPQGIVTRGLVAHYKFNEGSGQTLTDHSGYGNHGQLGSTSGVDTADPTWTGQGLSFGGDDYVGIGNVGKTMRTMQFVFYNNIAIDASSTVQVLVNFSTTGSPSYLSLGSVTGNLTNEIIALRATGSEGWCDATASISIGWNILDLRWNGFTFDIILNEVNKPLSVYTTMVPPTVSQLELGRYAGGSSYFNGLQGYLLLYDVSLNNLELKQNRKAIKEILQVRGVSLA